MNPLKCSYSGALANPAHLYTTKLRQDKRGELHVKWVRSPHQCCWSPKTSCRKTGWPQTTRSTIRMWGKRRRDVSSFLWRLCSLISALCLFVLLSTRSTSVDVPHASQATSSPRAPQIAVLNTRRRIRGTTFSSLPPLGFGVEKIAWIFGSNHSSHQLSEVNYQPRCMCWAPFNCKFKRNGGGKKGERKPSESPGRVPGRLMQTWRKTVCECVCVRERYGGKRGGKLLTTKYSEREIRVTKRGRGEIIQQLSQGNVICL